MNKKMSRYKGLILSCVSMMMIVVCVCSFSFESNAEGTVYNVLSERPIANEYAGYMELLMTHDTNGSKVVFVIYWLCEVTNTGSIPYVEISAYTSGSLGIQAFASQYITIYYCSSDGRTSPNELYDGVVGPGDISLSDYFEPWTINAINFYGNVGSFYFNGSSYAGSSAQFVVTYGSETNALNKLASIYSELVKANANDTTMINKINQIYNSVDTVESKLQQLIDLQEESNTWLEKIWNSIQEFLNPTDEDKQESEELENESTEKTDKLDDLNEQNKTDKTDIDDASNSVDENVDLESIDNYGKVLATITENQYILQILLLVFSVALVAYVLFGKK